MPAYTSRSLNLDIMKTHKKKRKGFTVLACFLYYSTTIISSEITFLVSYRSVPCKLRYNWLGIIVSPDR